MAPHPESAAAAVATLRAQLEMAVDVLEAIDRKAACAGDPRRDRGDFIAPDIKFTSWQRVVNLAALVPGIASVIRFSTVTRR